MNRSEGVLRQGVTPQGEKLVLEVDPGIVDLARALVPKAVRLNRQKFAPHATVVRDEPGHLALSPFHEVRVEFEYESEVRNNNVYYWLNLHCPRLNAIRVELGLPFWNWACRPPDNQDCFHITIGNCK
jgi:hypothetical protein